MDRHLLLRLMPLLEAAQRLPAGERETWCQQQNLSAADLRTLKKLLAERLSATSQVLNEPALPDDDALPEPVSDLQAGHLIGPWQLQRELGQGGMSVVWLAHLPDQPDQPVALKIPHAGPGQALLAQRLQRERSILASLQHPHIARLLDTGTTPQGLPYLVLEYVEGQSLLAHANARRLDVRARLQLMQQVLEAVQHAHNQLVLHRDLKPANILVTPQGQVKLLDFGIAKLLSGTTAESTALTRQGGHVLTPDYAAPEQVSGGTLSTRTDVYALGVILYELLTGCRPYRLPRGSRGALEQAILNTQAEPPSHCWSDTSDDAPHLAQAFGSTPRQLHQALSGDLDVIVLKALQKQPDRRYPTADALAQDLARHLRDEPIQARGDSRWYRTRKFVARHALVLGATAAVIVSLSVGLSMALWQARQARLEAAKATAIKDFMVGLFKANDLDQVDAPRKRQQSVQDLLQDSAKALGGQGLSGQPQVRAELQGVVGTLLHDLQLSDAAIALRRQRIELLSRTGAGAEALVPAWRDLADSQDVRGDLAGMRQSLEQALQLCRHRNMSPAVDCHGAQVMLGWLDLVEHHLPDAARRIESSTQALLTLAPAHERTAEAMFALGELRQEQGRSEEALRQYESSLLLRERLWGTDSVRMARLRHELGMAFWAQKQLTKAEQHMRLAHDVLQQSLGADHIRLAITDLQWRRLRSQVHLNEEDWQQLQHAAKTILAHATDVDPADTLWARTVPLEIALMSGRLQLAGQLLAELDSWVRTYEASERQREAIDFLKSRYLYETGQYEQALALLRMRLQAADNRSSTRTLRQDLEDRIQIIAVASGRAHDIKEPVALATTRSRYAQVLWLIAQQRYQEALPLSESLMREQTQRPRKEQLAQDLVGHYLRHGEVLLGLNRWQEAKAAFEKAIASNEGGYSHSVHVAAARLKLAQCLQALGHATMAKEQGWLAHQTFAIESSAGPHLNTQTRQQMQARGVPVSF